MYACAAEERCQLLVFNAQLRYALFVSLKPCLSHDQRDTRDNIVLGSEGIGQILRFGAACVPQFSVF
jgi:hypothetical protein